MAYLLGLVIYGTSGGSDEDDARDNASDMDTAATTNKEQQQQKHEERHGHGKATFYAFRRKYLAVYVVIMLADWVRTRVTIFISV